MATPADSKSLKSKGRIPSGQLSSPVVTGEEYQEPDVHMRGSSIMVGDTQVLDAPLKIHEKQIDDVVKELGSDVKNGLTKEQAKKLQEEHGPNELEKPPRISLFMLFIVQLNSVIMYLLLAAVVASAVIKATGDEAKKFMSYIDSIAILVIVLINATIAAVTENNANDALEALSSLQSPNSAVIRDGEEQSIPSSELTVGDIILMMTGDVVPADVRVIEASDLRVNEMLLTGEPEDVAKNNKVKIPEPGQPAKLTPDNMAFSSSNVKAGESRCIVTAIGMKTRVGSIAALLNDASGGADPDTQPTYDAEGNVTAPPKRERNFDEYSANCFGLLPDTKSGQSPLQANLENLAIKLGYMAIGVCTLVFVVGVVMGTTDPESPETPSWLFMILVAVTLTVAAIPEGLPLCVTIALSAGCESMVSKNVLMRKIAAVETLGSASIICTDKTGTLTEGKMTLVAMFAGLVDYTVTGKGFDPNKGGITVKSTGEDAKAAGDVLATLGSAVLCSNTTVAIETDPESPNFEKWTPKGNSSEAPLVVGGMKCGIKLDDMKATLEPVKAGNIPFSSSRKMMVTVTKTVGDEKVLKHVAALNEYTAHVKGAPNYIMDKCTSYLASDGSVQPMDDQVKKTFMDRVDDLSSQALRVLAVATKPIGAELPWAEGDEIETDEKFKLLTNELTMCGLCASIDPERDGVKEAVKTSRTAGCRVVMITGDYLKTAIAIAKNINILNKDTFVEGNGEATDCGALRPVKEGVYLENTEFDAMTANTNVFARAKPEDKLEIVKSLQRQGWVCAMTGDGVNDAPALQRADIGVAMGLEGTEVAKGASDMILTDDNFCSIVDAIEQGRVIYAGIQKFVSFIMSVHFAEVMQIFLCIVTNIPVMRQPLQILFLILVTDLPPSIALGFEPKEPDVMLRKPRPKTQPVVLVSMWGGIVAHGMILTTCIFCTYLVALWAYAGAFLTEDITSDTRTKCNIWTNDKWGPQGDIECYSDPGNTTSTYQNGCDVCIETSIRRARTCAFISLVWAEGLRAYVSRSFENGFWINTFNNPSMNYAVAMAQVTLIIALFLPGFNEEVLGLYVYEIHYFGWIFAFFGASFCLLFCEIFKFFASKYVEKEGLANYSEDDDKDVKPVGVVVDDESAEGTTVEMETPAYPPKNANVNVDLLPDSEEAAGAEQPPELFSPTTGARM